MKTRKFIYDLHREREKVLSRHARQPANILSRLTCKLDKHPLPYKIDFNFPYHLIVNCNGTISVFAGGFDKHIDIQLLTANGKPDNRSPEYCTLTPKGAVNYILRKWGKPKRK